MRVHIPGPEPGLTRDVIRAALNHQGTKVELIDTAGYVGATKVGRWATLPPPFLREQPDVV